ncbi:MAG: 5-oxoprolinase subunit PxpA [Hyphomonas sp.]
MTRSICLNADIGELPGEAGRALDGDILKVVTRCNIACGGHAGDEESMAATLSMAAKAGVLVGAHPSYPDREGFGRTRNSASQADLATSLEAQVAGLIAIAGRIGTRVSHIKPHGALYNDAARDPDLGALVAGLCRESRIPTLLGPPASELETAARKAGIAYIAEGFADRSYEPDGSLTPRSVPGSVFEDHERQCAQVLSIVLDRRVKTRTGTFIELPVQTICLHGDTPGAAANAARLRAALDNRGIAVRP